MGQPFNGDHFLEQKFLELRDKYGIRYVIETGTYHGHTTKWLAENFEHVATIEVKEENIREAEKIIPSSVFMFKGSSSEMLWSAIEGMGCPNNMIIFLDAHWYKNPVLAELKQIAKSHCLPILAIHDFYNPNDPTMGYDKYPEQGIEYNWEWIKDAVEEIYGDASMYTVEYNKEAAGARRGCIFVIPKEIKSSI
jgi:hypothetical protein